MASFNIRLTKDGKNRYEVCIRKKGLQIDRTFSTQEDAKLWAFYKERLIDNMENFDVPKEEMITLEQIVELKCKEGLGKDLKNVAHIRLAKDRFNEIFGRDKFYHQITYDDWLNAAKSLAQSIVYRGGKTEASKRIMSPTTLRRYLAYISSCVTNVQRLGYNVENHPLKVIQTFVIPLL